MKFLNELRQRNPPLYWFGWYNLLAGIVCLALVLTDDGELLGINRWIKPAKFFLSVGIMVWTMGWLLHYLDAKRKIKIISWLIVFSMFFENGLIACQAIRGQPSHFNNTTPLNAILFSMMGVMILIFTITIIYATYLFFRQKIFTIPPSYYWGIRLGLLFFIFFSLEGGIMIGMNSHTVGGPDGEAGLPFVNWSTSYGDLRIAHFLGLHSLQILPLAGYFLTRTKKQVIIFSVVWFLLITSLLLMALKGIPVFRM